MGEPARKIHEDIEPEIRPNLHVIEGGGESTSSRANLKALESNPEKTDDKSSIKDREESGSNVVQGPWGNKVTGKQVSPTKGKFNLAGLKKKGPLAAIIAILFGLVGIGSSFYPVALTQSVYSNLIDKFNIQETSASFRSNKIIARKMSTDLTENCVITKIFCKFTRPSNRFLDQLEKNGIRALDREGNTITKRLFPNTRPSRYQFVSSTGEIIDATADELPAKLANNAEFRNAMRKSTKTRFMSLADDVFEKVRAKFGFSTDNKIADVADDVANTADDAVDDVADDVANTLDDSIDDVVGVLDDGVDNLGDDAARAALNSADDVLKMTAVTNQLSDTVTDAAVATAKVGSKGGDTTTLVASILCGVADIPGITTKSVRNFQITQLVKYSALILATFGAIRALDAIPEETNAVGNLLTTPVDGKSAMDSDGINYIINNSLPSGENYKKFIPGASILAILGTAATVMNSPVKKSVCATMTNPVTGQAINGVLAINGGNTLGATILVAMANIAAAWTISEAMEWVATETDLIPTIVGAIASVIDIDKILEYFVGDLTKGLAGEPVGDALVSGASHIMGQTANSGGNVPLTVEQAVAYNEQTKKLQIAYAEEDRATKSPFDISSRYTMLGSFVYNLVPHLVKGYRVAGVATNSITTVASVILGSFSSLFNPVKAMAADPSQEYKMCEDPEMQDNDIAAGPYCNIIYGVPTEYLDKDPYELAKKLVASGDINEDTGEPIEDSDYKAWLDLCTTGDTYNARLCKIDDKAADYAVYTIDYRIQRSMDEEPTTTNSSSTPGGSADPGDASQPDNTVASGKGWKLKPGVDYSGVVCAEGTNDIGVFTTGPDRNIQIRLCQVPNTNMKVTSLISKRLVNMIKAAAADGMILTGGGFRTYEQQWTLRVGNCPDPVHSKASACTPHTAKAGYSMHEAGLAIDFRTPRDTLRSSDPEFRWMQQNAESYGFFNLPSESWHWSMSGG